MSNRAVITTQKEEGKNSKICTTNILILHTVKAQHYEMELLGLLLSLFSIMFPSVDDITLKIRCG